MVAGVDLLTPAPHRFLPTFYASPKHNAGNGPTKPHYFTTSRGVIHSDSRGLQNPPPPPKVYNRFRLHVSPPQHRARNGQEVTARREQSQQRGGKRKKKKRAQMPGVVLSHTFRLTALFLNNFLWEVQTPLKTLRRMRHTPCSANQRSVLARRAKQTTILQRKYNNPELRLLI